MQYTRYSTLLPRMSNENKRKLLQERPESPLLGQHLAHKDNGYPEKVRHFGLSLLENGIRFRWNDGSYGDAEREQLKEAVVDLVQNGLHDMRTEKMFIKTKVAALFVEVAKRTYPMKWLNMDKILRNLYASSISSQEIVMFIWRSLMEDIYLYEDVVAQLRKEELKYGVLAVTVHASMVEELYAKYQVQPQNVTPGGMVGGVGTPRTHVGLALDLVGAYPDNVGWLIRWSRTALEMHERWVTEGAIECIVVLNSRRMEGSKNEKNQTDCILSPLFDQGGCDQLRLAWNKAHGLSEAGIIDFPNAMLNESDYRFVKRIAQVISSTGEFHIGGQGLIHPAPSGLDRYLEFLLVIGNHPSVVVSAMPLKFWLNVFEKTVTLDEVLEPVISRLLDQCAAGILNSKTTDDHNLSESVRHYKTMEFDDVHEWRGFRLSLLLKYIEIIKSIVKIKVSPQFSDVTEIDANSGTLFQPVPTLAWLTRRVQKLMTLQPSPTFADEYGYQRVHSPLVAEFRATAAILEAAVLGISDWLTADLECGEHQALVPTIMQLAELVSSYQTSEPLILFEQLQMIASFSRYLGRDTRLLYKCLDMMIHYSTFLLPHERDHIRQNIPVREDTRAVRVRAIANLIRFAGSMSDTLMALYDRIARDVHRLLQSEDLLTSDRQLLVEFLLSIIEYSKSPVAQKQRLFDELIGPFITEWSELPMHILGTPEALMELMGIPDMANVAQLSSCRDIRAADPALADALDGRDRKRKLVLTHVWALRSWLTRSLNKNAESEVEEEVASPLSLWLSYLSSIIPNVLLCIRAVHLIWEPHLWQELPEELSQILEISPVETALYLKKDLQKDDYKHRRTALEWRIYTLRRHLHQLRDGWLTQGRMDFYGRPNLAEDLKSSIFAGAEFMHNQALLTVLSPILPAVLQCMDKKLESEWKTLLGRGMQESNPEDYEAWEDLSVEVMEEKILRDLTNTYVAMISSLFTLVDPSGKKYIPKGQSPFKHKEVVQFVLSSESIAAPMFQSGSGLITYKDTRASRRALLLWRNLVPILAPMSIFNGFLGKELLVATLKALHDGYLKENHSEAVAVITLIYTILRKSSSDIPYKTMLTVPGMTEEALQAFETELISKESPKAQEAVVRSFFSTITGVAVSQWFQKRESFILNASEKALLTRTTDTHADDVLNEDGDAGVGALFPE
ncbi:hypothetical protein HK104_000937 [Borealophlyctis nickersoniae]|nr:hypothetical protein HK104_000937 [Borealophlyctis nickersoniae]